MKRGRISHQALLYLLMMMFLVVTIGCSKSDDAPAVPTYSVSGTVTGASGVTMNLTGDKTSTTTTATDGTYSFTGLPVGNYTVTPVKTGYTFDPLSQGGHLTASQTGVNFAATANTGLTYSISGAVSGAVLAGVTITLSGDANAVTVTNASGNYSFPGIALNGNYTVTPSLAGYTFSPTGTGVIVSGADSTGNNFTATANTATTYSISGAVNGDAVAGVTITLSGSTIGTAITTTGASGTYSFPGLLPGSYTVTPSLTGYTFTAPISITLSANSTGNNFTSTNVSAIYSISGTVTGASGVTINLTGAATASTTGGSFSFTGLANGTYTVTPVKTGYKFSPASSSVTIAGGNITGTDFSATSTTAATYSIYGTVSGEVKSGVTITLSGTGSGTTTTNSSGNYSFSGLVAGSYTLTPSLAGYTITPTSLSPTISSANVTGQNFVVGTASTFSQADLTGTWYMNNLRKDKWMRGQISINASGVATCVSMSDSGGGTCPSPFDLTLTMNTSTGVITQTGANAANAGTDHMTMTSTKNLMVGTATNGSSGSYKYQLVILQKMGGSYSTTNVQSVSSFVQHQLSVGSNNEWRYGTGHTAADGEVWIDSEYKPSGPVSTGDAGVKISVTTSGVVTMSGDMATYEGFLSDDKRTIVGTWTETGSGYTDYRLMIIQIPETGQFTTGPLSAGIAYAHMLGCGTGFAAWIHDTTTVASDGTMTFSDWVDSFGGSAPSTTYTGNIADTSGTLTITGNDTFNGQISHDKKFIVGTQTNSGYYFLNVNTK
jgi:hypothetical protein